MFLTRPGHPRRRAAAAGPVTLLVALAVLPLLFGGLGQATFVPVKLLAPFPGVSSSSSVLNITTGCSTASVGRPVGFNATTGYLRGVLSTNATNCRGFASGIGAGGSAEIQDTYTLDTPLATNVTGTRELIANWTVLPTYSYSYHPGTCNFPRPTTAYWQCSIIDSWSLSITVELVDLTASTGMYDSPIGVGVGLIVSYYHPAGGVTQSQIAKSFSSAQFGAKSLFFNDSFQLHHQYELVWTLLLQSETGFSYSGTTLSGGAGGNTVYLAGHGSRLSLDSVLFA